MKAPSLLVVLVINGLLAGYRFDVRGIEERGDVQIAVSLEEHALRRSGQKS